MQSCKYLRCLHPVCRPTASLLPILGIRKVLRIKNGCLACHMILLESSTVFSRLDFSAISFLSDIPDLSFVSIQIVYFSRAFCTKKLSRTNVTCIQNEEQHFFWVWTLYWPPQIRKFTFTEDLVLAAWRFQWLRALGLLLQALLEFGQRNSDCTKVTFGDKAKIDDFINDTSCEFTSEQWTFQFKSLDWKVPKKQKPLCLWETIELAAVFKFTLLPVIQIQVFNSIEFPQNIQHIFGTINKSAKEPEVLVLILALKCVIGSVHIFPRVSSNNVAYGLLIP